MRNAYIIIHKSQIGNIKIVCNLKASPEGIAHPKLLLKVNFENSSIQKGYKSIILNKKRRRGSQESIELKRILWNFVSWSAPQIFDQNFEFWILRIKEVPFEHGNYSVQFSVYLVSAQWKLPHAGETRITTCHFKNAAVDAHSFISLEIQVLFESSISSKFIVEMTSNSQYLVILYLIIVSIVLSKFFV